MELIKHVEAGELRMELLACAVAEALAEMTPAYVGAEHREGLEEEETSI